MDYIIFLRQFKLGSFAIFDLVLAYLGIYLLAPTLSKIMRLLKLEIPRSTWIWLTLPIGVLFHLIFAQNTPLNAMLFDPSGNYLVKVVIVLMTIIGIAQVKRIK
jgi:hypothetical protein